MRESNNIYGIKLIALHLIPGIILTVVFIPLALIAKHYGLPTLLSIYIANPMSRWANRILGILYAMIVLVFWVLGFVFKSAGYEFVWSTAQLVFALLVVWYSWKWPKQEA